MSVRCPMCTLVDSGPQKAADMWISGFVSALAMPEGAHQAFVRLTFCPEHERSVLEGIAEAIKCHDSPDGWVRVDVPREPQ